MSYRVLRTVPAFIRTEEFIVDSFLTVNSAGKIKVDIKNLQCSGEEKQTWYII